MTPEVPKSQPTPLDLVREARRLAQLRAAIPLRGLRDGDGDDAREAAGDHDDDPKVAA